MKIDAGSFAERDGVGKEDRSDCISGSSTPAFRFIDLCAGIGGMRIAAEQNGGECVFSCEVNKSAAKVYEENFSEDPTGDLTEIDLEAVPEHDLLIAGFPCQPFSICGYKRGFEDTRGTIFFHILNIIKEKNPQCVLLENVKHFAQHDSGRTKAVIISALEELGYQVADKVLNATDFGLAQNRERTIIVASRSGTFRFEFPDYPRKCILDIVEEDAEHQEMTDAHVLLSPEKLKTQPKSGLKFVGYRKKAIRKAGVREGTEHLSRTHKQPNRIYSAEGTHPTLAAGETSGRYWILEGDRIRKLTLRECYRLQGFPDSFKLCQSQTQAYKQVGNSVPIPMIGAVISALLTQDLL
jgi:DNA (cytosine-5)-methyltransferase 1